MNNPDLNIRCDLQPTFSLKIQRKSAVSCNISWCFKIRNGYYASSCFAGIFGDDAEMLGRALIIKPNLIPIQTSFGVGFGPYR